MAEPLAAAGMPGALAADGDERIERVQKIETDPLAEPCSHCHELG